MEKRYIVKMVIKGFKGIVPDIVEYRNENTSAAGKDFDKDIKNAKIYTDKTAAEKEADKWNTPDGAGRCVVRVLK